MDSQVLAYHYSNWICSKERKSQITGRRYYEGKQDILCGETCTGFSDMKSPKIVDNQYYKAVNQKCNYLLGKNFKFQCENNDYKFFWEELITQKFLRGLTTDMLNYGISWVYAFLDENGGLRLKKFKSEDVLPIWEDVEHEKLLGLLRIYSIYSEKIGEPPKIFGEYYTQYGVDTYEVPEFKFLSHTDYIFSGNQAGQAENLTYNFSKIPIIPLKLNSSEIPLINRVKSLQDALNRCMSSLARSASDDIHSTILILENYEGIFPADANETQRRGILKKLRKDIDTAGIICINNSLVKCDLRPLKIDIETEKFLTAIEELRKAIVKNSFTVDIAELKSGTPNQMNIQAAYGDLEVDADAMEQEIKTVIAELKPFVDDFLILTKNIDYSKEDISIVFDRDMVFNETEVIENIVKLTGIISEKSQLKNIPESWNIDPDEEIKLKSEEQSGGDIYPESFANQLRG